MTEKFPEPDAGNDFLAGHVADLLRSYYALTGKHLIASAEDAAKMAYDALQYREIME